MSQIRLVVLLIVRIIVFRFHFRRVSCRFDAATLVQSSRCLDRQPRADVVLSSRAPSSSCRLVSMLTEKKKDEWKLIEIKMAARERDSEGLKVALRSGIEAIPNRLCNDILNDEDGTDYLCSYIDRILNLLARASTLFCIPEELVTLLLRSRHVVVKMNNEDKDDVRRFFYTGCRGRPTIDIPKEQLELHLEYGFTAGRIAELFGVSSKTIFRRIAEFVLEIKQYSDLSDMELDNVMYV